jgi:allantoate deiminase
MSIRAQQVVDWCRRLATMSEEPGRTTRTFLSAPMHDVHRVLGDWMREFGMQVTVDAAGNLRGVLAGDAPRVMIGSHLDTVPNAGAFDGILGVVLGIALCEIASRRARRPILEVVGFSEEEGVRYGAPFIGSRALVGTLDTATLAMAEAAIREFGLEPEDIPDARFAAETTAYLEFHIEQGPVLESLRLPLGIVDAIAGQSRVEVTFEGQANHAGTTPMALRHDALAAASQWILRVEQEAGAHDGLVATVGRVHLEPNATNVIPGRVTVSLDVRHGCDDNRLAAVRQLMAAASSIAGRRKVQVKWEERVDQASMPMDATLLERLAMAVEGSGYPVHRMTSGAGHDAMIVAPHIPSAMLFLRSPGGISHSPEESVSMEDVEAAMAVGERFLCL